MPAETLLMALGVGVVVGVLLGIGLVGLIGANRERAAPSTLPPRSVNGATLEAVFVHHVTPEDTSGNSTYLDDPPTEGNPNAVLVVTQNWNPGGSDHLERTNGGKVAINRNRCRPSARRSARNRIPTRTALGFTLDGFCQKQVKGLPSPKPRTRRGRRSA